MIREIEVGEDLRVTRTSWAAERVGWVLLAALLAAGLLGFLGPGLFSGARAEGPATVEYERFARLENEGELRVRLEPGARSLWIENRWLDRVKLRGVRPEPERVTSEAGWTVFTFAGTRDVDARLEIQHHRVGKAAGRFGTSPARAVDVRQFVYP
ncbi:MAG TPA: hypothetical protein VF950_25265 [Planctomycetota bacterium]